MLNFSTVTLPFFPICVMHTPYSSKQIRSKHTFHPFQLRNPTERQLSWAGHKLLRIPLKQLLRKPFPELPFFQLSVIDFSSPDLPLEVNVLLITTSKKRTGFSSNISSPKLLSLQLKLVQCPFPFGPSRARTPSKKKRVNERFSCRLYKRRRKKESIFPRHPSSSGFLPPWKKKKTAADAEWTSLIEAVN